MPLCRFIKEQYGFIVVVSHITRVTCKFQVGFFGCCMSNMLENLYVSCWPFLIYFEVTFRALAMTTTIRLSTLLQYVPNFKYLFKFFITCPVWTHL